jgi:hypothetical protein
MDKQTYGSSIQWRIQVFVLGGGEHDLTIFVWLLASELFCNRSLAPQAIAGAPETRPLAGSGHPDMIGKKI